MFASQSSFPSCTGRAMLFSNAPVCATALGAREPEALECRNYSFSFKGDDERDELAELRDDSEPLDVLKWELTALKLERELDNTSKSREKPKAEAKSTVVKSLPSAEIDVNNVKKTVPIISLDIKPQHRALLEKIGLGQSLPFVPLGGTEDNPIPATKSLDVASASDERGDNQKEPPTYETSQKSPSPKLNSTRPPLPPRSKAASPTPSLSSKLLKRTTSPPHQSTKEQRESPEASIGVSIMHSYSQPIVINSDESEELTNYDEPIIVHSEDVGDTEEQYSQLDYNRVNIEALIARKRAAEERVLSPCRNSSIVKSPYSRGGLSVAADEEMATQESPIDSERKEPEHIDLSQVDADELEAEYARLLREKRGEESPSESSDEEDISQARSETEELIMVPSCLEPSLKDIDEEVGPYKRKSLDMLRQRSMVSEAESSDEQDVKGLDSPQIINLEEATDEEEEEDSGVEERSRSPDNSEPAGQVPQKTAVGQEPPETLPKRSSSEESSDDTQNEVEENFSDGERSGYGEETLKNEEYEYPKNEEYDFFAPLPPRNDAQGKAKLPCADYDFPSIERVVADYFGAKNRLTDDGSTGSTGAAADFGKSIFSGATRGCCIGL